MFRKRTQKCSRNGRTNMRFNGSRNKRIMFKQFHSIFSASEFQCGKHCNLNLSYFLFFSSCSLVVSINGKAQNMSSIDLHRNNAYFGQDQYKHKPISIEFYRIAQNVIFGHCQVNGSPRLIDNLN